MLLQQPVLQAFAGRADLVMGMAFSRCSCYMVVSYRNCIQTQSARQGQLLRKEHEQRCYVIRHIKTHITVRMLYNAVKWGQRKRVLRVKSSMTEVRTLNDRLRRLVEHYSRDLYGF